MSLNTPARSAELASLSDRIDAVRASPFDLTARAALALNACTRLTDPQLDGLPYSYAEFQVRPAVALHSPWDYYDTAGRLLSALTLARILTGTAPDTTDEQFATLLRKHQREDGLLALPASPWTHPAPVVEMEWSPRGALLAWTTRYLALDDTDARQRATRLVHSLYKSACWQGDTCWFPASFLPERGWHNTLPPFKRMTDVLIGGQIIFPLALFADATGNGKAIQLANGLIRFLREQSGAFDENGDLTPLSGRYFHSDTSFILGALKHGLLVGNDEEIAWAHNAYKKAMQHGTDFGFFPYNRSGEGRHQGDTCAIADMIEIAILLGLHGETSCFADAERFGRNHLLQSQILDMRWAEGCSGMEFSTDLWCRNHPDEGITTEEVCERALGGFAGWSRPNDAFDPACPRLMQRGTGSGLNALYALWHYGILRHEEAVMVNLHFSRDTRWATVTSHIPQEGCVEVLMKTRGVLAVRLPEGISHQTLEITVNHQRRREVTLRNGYAWLECLQNGDLVTLRWPQVERAVVYDLNDHRYLGKWRGDTMLGMEPYGKLAPLYHYDVNIPSATPQDNTSPVREIETL